jgi:pimeloyl-ACP methyl ester carboxylesterase
LTQTASDRTDTYPTAIVLLHGVGGAARIWAPQMASFAAAGYRPVALDLPGYGARPPVDVLDFEALAADVEATIDRLGLHHPVLLGHSLGGMIAQTALRRRPQHYAAAILSGTSPIFGSRDGSFQKKFLQDRLGPLDLGMSMRELAPRLVDEIMGPQPDPAGRALAVELMSAVDEQTYRASMQCLTAFDERANLGLICVPVLCLAGEHDRNAPPAMMQRMAEKIPGSRYICLDDVGHLPNLEAPKAFDAAVLDFLASVTA